MADVVRPRRRRAGERGAMLEQLVVSLTPRFGWEYLSRSTGVVRQTLQKQIQHAHQTDKLCAVSTLAAIAEATGTEQRVLESAAVTDAMRAAGYTLAEWDPEAGVSEEATAARLLVESLDPSLRRVALSVLERLAEELRELGSNAGHDDGPHPA